MTHNDAICYPFYLFTRVPENEQKELIKFLVKLCFAVEKIFGLSRFIASRGYTVSDFRLIVKWPSFLQMWATRTKDLTNRVPRSTDLLETSHGRPQEICAVWVIMLRSYARRNLSAYVARVCARVAAVRSVTFATHALVVNGARGPRRDSRFARMHVCTRIERMHGFLAGVSREPSPAKNALEARAAQTMFIIVTICNMCERAMQRCSILTLSTSPLLPRFFPFCMQFAL